jgi:hypothetical protein
MACFITPTIIAVITTLIQKTVGRKIEKLKLGILNTLLWGGAALLAIEHVWHGEVVPWPPFLTAMTNPADIPIMLHEMTMVGGLMTISIFTMWGLILLTPKIISTIALHRVEKPRVSPITKT